MEMISDPLVSKGTACSWLIFLSFSNNSNLTKSCPGSYATYAIFFMPVYYKAFSLTLGFRFYVMHELLRVFAAVLANCFPHRLSTFTLESIGGFPSHAEPVCR